MPSLSIRSNSSVPSPPNETNFVSVASSQSLSVDSHFYSIVLFNLLMTPIFIGTAPLGNPVTVM